MKIYPLNDRILVKRVEATGISKGGIHLPDTAKERPQRGTVIAVGPGKLNEDRSRMTIDIKPGTIVLFTNYAGSEVKENGEDFLILSESDILAIIA